MLNFEILLWLGLMLGAFAVHALRAGAPSAPTVQRARTTRVWQAVALGGVGGVIGGFSAFPSAAIVVWHSMRGVNKEAARPLICNYIIGMQILALVMLCVVQPETFQNPDFLEILLLAAPLALLANYLGWRIYAQTGHALYRVITLVALGCSGLTIVVKALVS